MPKQVATENELEDEFHRLLGRLVHASARFDFYIGLQLNYLGPYRRQDVSGLLRTDRARLSDRLKRLRELVLETYATAGAEFSEEFNRWFEDAEHARVLRNDCAHGRWAVPAKYGLTPDGRRDLSKPILAFVPLDFDMTPDQPDKSEYMTIEDFAEQVFMVENLFGRYWQLCEKHIGHALPAPNEGQP